MFLEVNNLTKHYGALPVLKGLSFSIDEGESVAIMGASGAGKTTLLHILGLLDSADGGSVVIKGTSLFELSGRKKDLFRNKRIGFIFQSHELLPEFTAEENAALPAMIAGMKKEEALNKAQHLLASLNLSERLHHKPAALSGGEKQRVAIARALINDPDILLADEPSGSLDSKNKIELHNLLTKIRQERHQTMLIATHDAELAATCMRTLIISDGQIVNSTHGTETQTEGAI